jgi:Cu-Zn family superoxide dismutase
MTLPFQSFQNHITGPHYNPHSKEHGGPSDSERHAGDLGNIEADARGRAEGEIADHLVKLYGDYSIVGRALMVHADPDDLGRGGFSDSKSTGHAGARVACGEVKLM